MKVTRLSLVVILFVVFFASPVQAQAGVRYGFVPLLTQVDAATPFRAQAQRAWQRMLPQLLAAKRNGSVLEFDPELSAGIVKIKFAAGANTLTIGKAQVVDNIHAAVAMVPHNLPARAQGDASALSPNFQIYVYDSCFNVKNSNINSYVVASLRDKSNVVISTTANTTDGSGNLTDCFGYASSYANILPGYKVTFKLYDTIGGTLLGTYSIVVSNITFTAVNKTTSVISGTGPAQKAYSLWWSHDNLNAANNTLNVTKTGTIPATGKWAVDFGTTPIRGGDSFEMSVSPNSTFTFSRVFDAPWLFCQLASNFCVLHGFPLQASSLSITHGGKVYNFTGKFTLCGCFTVELTDTVGNPISLVAGDKVSGTGISAYTLPNLTVTPNFVNSSVTGKAPANRYFATSIYDSGWGNSYFVWAHTNSAGNYVADYSGQIILNNQNPLSFQIYYVDSVTGNTTDRYTVVGP